MTNSTEVKEFYDNFTNTRMLQYKLYGNLRLEKAIRLITNYLTPNSKHSRSWLWHWHCPRTIS